MATAPLRRRWAEPGHAESDFLLVVRRFAGPVRGVLLVLVSVFGTLAAPAAQVPLAFALLGLAVVCGAADVVAGWTDRGTRAALVLTVVRAAAICLAQDATAPVPGGVNQWAFNTLTITAITMQWQWPPRVTVPALAAVLAVSLPSSGADDTLMTVLRVLIESVLARLALMLLLRSAREVDSARERQVESERAESVALARRREEREYLALLHDTASATFLMVASRGADSDPDEVARYARRDLDVLTGFSDDSQAYDGLVALEPSLRPVLEHSPLDVNDRWDQSPMVPVPVALALVRALREALLNVERHAGVAEVDVHVAAEGGGVAVTVTDTGRGFDPAAVPADRHGVRGSLVERMRAAGGSAVVSSSPGSGTTVRLAWSDD
ncbi:sensor histidine kinase [Prauserella cavernicola]|uniref:ATP-binding protein n=1 Tax=Prauserella cavernicola TaxID=2800127 RepID=A0A934V3Q4_9PSEU|nr:ATP-binding protein [Prauserella cavernicola]MBK1787526.1 ATP-binding protein [Prauserella cavernicola]